MSFSILKMLSSAKTCKRNLDGQSPESLKIEEILRHWHTNTIGIG